MSNELKKKGVLLMYSYEGTNTYVDVYFQDETFWLTQAGMAELFDCAKSNISMHLKTIFAEEELDEATVMRKFRISELSTKPTNFYNLDAIIAVGYRVNSKKATRFRQWATRTLREYIQKGFVLNDEMMKNGRAFGRDYFDELLEHIREIRASVCWGKGSISHEAAVKKVSDVYAEFRKKQDADYVSEFDRETAKYLKGTN